ncbi:hypothetical protein LCGC14_1348280, partial [marine sediment metagenome]
MADNNSNGKGFMGILWDAVSGFFTIGFEKVWTNYLETTWKGYNTLTEKFNDWMANIDDNLWWDFTNFMHDHEWIDDETRNDLNTLSELTFPFNLLAYTVASGGLLTTWLKQLMFAAGADQRRRLFTKYEPVDIDASALLSASLLAPEKKEEIKVILKSLGYGDDQIDLLFTAITKAYDEGTIRTLYLRGVLSDEQMIARMKELGFTTEKIAEIKEAWPIIPGAGDLFHLVAKEAFEPDIIKHYGYDEEFPVDQIKWLKMQGISEDWARKYWYAHWETPSIQAGYEMLHRNVIDYKELNDLFRTIEIPPFWRDKLTKIAFMPYTRVDTRRMHNAGVLSTEELINAYMDVGYDLEHATKMTEFTITYNADSGKKLTKAQIVNGFDEYLLTYNEAKTMLTTIKYTEDQADFILTFTEYERTKKYNATVEKTIKKRFLLSLITEAQTRDKLNELNLPGEKVVILLNQWTLDKYDN